MSATAGVENSSGTLGRQYSFGQSLLTNGTAASCSSGPAAPSGPTITTPSLPNGANGVGYSQTLAATGGTSPYTFTLDSGNLPGGLGLSPGGTISGTPNAPGSFGFVVKVTDSGNPAQSSTKGFTITIASPVAVTTGSLSAGVKGKAYSQTLAASGGTTPYTWSLAAGSLPPGTSLNSTTGTIAGSPTTVGTYGFTVRVTDSSAPSQSATRAFSVAVATQLKISTGNLPAGTVAETYSQTLAASGGTAPYAWSIASGALPPGLTLTASTGRISGTPTTVGTFSFTARVTDTGPPVQTVTKNMSIKITVLAVSTTSLPGVTRGQTYSQTLKASGGTTPYSWSIVSGSLPPGLSLASSTGKITGTATTAGTYAFTVKVTDSGSPAQSATKALSIKIS